MNSDKFKPRPHFLRLVETTSTPDPISHETFSRVGWQSTLFANENPALILFISFQEITEREFTTILIGARPKFLFDLRRVPRFDLGTLNRRQVFALFSKTGIQYWDFSRYLNTHHDRNPAHVARLIADASNHAVIRGPIAFLVDTQQFGERYITTLVEELPSAASMTWDVLRVPLSDAGELQPQQTRNIVFVSHANPEDNAFATWLAGQLTLVGYSVWSDVTRLVGGENLWDDIEEAIRLKAAKFIAVLSKRAQQKPGVLDEIDVAVRVERSVGLKRFVVPVRIDDLPYGEVRANIARKNIIDFSENWASGLRAVLEVLERDRVPRDVTGKADVLSHWIKDRIAQSSHLVRKAEVLKSNWLPITRFPEYIFLYNVSAPIDRIDAIVRSLTYPSFRYLGLIGSVASGADLQADLLPSFTVAEEYRVLFRQFLAGSPPELPGLSRREAGKLAINLLRQTWDLNMKRLGLSSFETASKRLAWYMPAGFLESDRVEFLDDEGKRRRKSLVGWSERRKVFWHFAVEAKPVLAATPHYLLKLHIIFTPDGKLPVDSKERMHLLRRRFCRSWWNDRWRDLLVAFVSWLSQRNSGQLAIGGASSLHVADNLMPVISPVTLGAAETLAMGSYDDDDQLDTVDDDEALEEELESATDNSERGDGQ